MYLYQAELDKGRAWRVFNDFDDEVITIDALDEGQLFIDGCLVGRTCVFAEYFFLLFHD